jgi:hypothetical protein
VIGHRAAEEDRGATSINLPVDPSPPQIAAIRQAIPGGDRFLRQAPDDFGGTVRHYEAAWAAHRCAHLSQVARNCGSYPAGSIRRTSPRCQRASRGAAIGLAILAR